MRRPMLARGAEKYQEWQRVVDLWHGHENSVLLAHEAYGEDISFGTFSSRLKTAKRSGIKPSVAFGCHVRPDYLQQGPQQAPMRLTPSPAMPVAVHLNQQGNAASSAPSPASGSFKPVPIITEMQPGGARPALHFPQHRLPDHERVMDLKQNQRMLWLSDLHMPYHHRDSFEFLAAVERKYEPDSVNNVGDETDQHCLSYHDHNPDLPSAGHELEKARGSAAELATIFPDMDIAESNHGSLLYRKAITHGIPRGMIREYREVLFGQYDKDHERIVFPGDLGRGWRWHDSFQKTMGNGQPVFCIHTYGVNEQLNAERLGMCFVQGHHHPVARVSYTSNPNALTFGMTVGCMIDRKAMGFAYNKVTPRRPIIACGYTENGAARILPMPLNGDGRWTGVVP